MHEELLDLAVKRDLVARKDWSVLPECKGLLVFLERMESAEDGVYREQLAQVVRAETAERGEHKDRKE